MRRVWSVVFSLALLLQLCEALDVARKEEDPRARAEEFDLAGHGQIVDGLVVAVVDDEVRHLGLHQDPLRVKERGALSNT